MSRSLLVMMLGALLVAGVAACGGERDKPARGSGSLTKVEYEVAFKVVMRAAKHDVRLDNHGSQQEKLQTVFRILERVATKLDALRPPAEAGQAHADFVAGLRGYIAYRRPILAALSSGDTAEAERLIDTPVPLKLRAKFLSASRFFAARHYDLKLGTRYPP